MSEILKVPEKSVYDLPIQRVRVSSNRVRWRPRDVRRFVERRLTRETRNRLVRAVRDREARLREVAEALEAIEPEPRS